MSSRKARKSLSGTQDTFASTSRWVPALRCAPAGMTHEMTGRQKRILQSSVGAIAIFIVGFAAGATYMTPAPGLYELTRVDCSDYESTIECATARPSMIASIAPSAEQCAPTTKLLNLMKQCRDSSVDGIGQHEACTIGDVSVPRKVEHLDSQIPLLEESKNLHCALTRKQLEPQP